MFRRLKGSGDAYWLDINHGSMVVHQNSMKFMVRERLSFVLTIGGVDDLKQDGIFRALTKLVLKVMISQKCDFPSNVRVEYSSNWSRDTVTRLLESRKYSDQTKLAAILGVLSFVPNMSFEDVEKYIKNQVSPSDVKSMTLQRNLLFLHPDFASDLTSVTDSRIKATLTPSEYEHFVSIASFMAHSRKDETFSQYFDRVPYGQLHPDLNSYLTFLYTQIGYSGRVTDGDPEKMKKDFANCTKDAIIRLYRLCQEVDPHFYPFILERLSKHKMLTEVTNDLDYSQKKTYQYWLEARALSHYLTLEEHDELLSQMVENIDKCLWHYILSTDVQLIPMLAYYFVIGGLPKVQELLLLIESNMDYNDFAVARDSWARMSGYRGVVQDLMRAIDPDLITYPLEWALQVSASEESTDIGNQLVR